MKQIPKKLRSQLDEFITAVCDQKLDDALQLVEKINWKTYNRASEFDLHSKWQCSVLHWLCHQHDEFCEAHPRRKNVFFKEVFQKALDWGYDPYKEDYLWHITNNELTPSVKATAQVLDAHNHDLLQQSSLISYVCSNYLVHPWMVKYTLSLPNAQQWVQQEPELLQNIWDGQTCGDGDEKEIYMAHRYLLNNNVIVTEKFVSDIPSLLEIYSDSQYHTQLEQLFEITRTHREKELLLSAITPTSKQSSARKM